MNLDYTLHFSVEGSLLGSKPLICGEPEDHVDVDLLHVGHLSTCDNSVLGLVVLSLVLLLVLVFSKLLLLNLRSVETWHQVRTVMNLIFVRLMVQKCYIRSFISF